MGATHEEADEVVVDTQQDSVSEFSWWRVAAVVGLVVVVAVVVTSQVDVTVSPDRTYNQATVVVDGQAFEAVACESAENGIEVRYGTHGAAVYVRHLASGETVIVLHSEAEERTARSVTRLEDVAADEWAYAAAFDDAPPVAVTFAYHDMGRCR